MKKNIARIAAIALALLFICSGPAVMAATKDPVSPCYENVSSVYARVKIVGDADVNCYGKINVRSGLSADMTLTLQRSKDGKSWSDVKTWEDSGTGSLSIDKDRIVSSGYQYRAYLEAVIYDAKNNPVETVSYISNVVSY